uniref:Uncharacterized protein At2g05020 n=1 Tax=Arabidopsis thaliana TaxID=3702 RepID=Q9SI24_ARATH|nr:hypothetical protein [Arabidopsis thaliana]
MDSNDSDDLSWDPTKRKSILSYHPDQRDEMTSPPIQKDIMHCFAMEVTKSVIQEINNDVFALLVDESADIPDKEQMTVVFRFVDKDGIVKERFVGISHVKETSSLSLKNAIDPLFTKDGLSLKKELSLQKPANTRWGTHYKTLLRIIEFFSCIIEYIEYIQDEDVDNIKRRQANGLLKYFHTFDFAFYLQLMLHILGFADILSQALQRRDQDILNVMSLVASTKREVDYYYNVLDMQLQAFNDLFDEVNSEILFWIASLSPMDSFSQFKKSMLVRLTELYLDDFSFVERISLDHQLDIYLDNVQRDERFTNFKSLGDLSRVMRKSAPCKQRWEKVNELVMKFVGCYATVTNQKASDQSKNDVKFWQTNYS